MVQGGLKKVQGGLEPPLAPHFPRLWLLISDVTTFAGVHVVMEIKTRPASAVIRPGYIHTVMIAVDQLVPIFISGSHCFLHFFAFILI